ncbi:synaptonemal complex central element protein 3 [Menidia menidia]
MAESSSVPEQPQSSGDILELNKDLEIMIEDVENISVQLAYMVYDMVALRTNPELGASMRKLEEAYQKCRGAVCGDPIQELKTDPLPDTEA